jgi:hypothetical protein
LQKLSSEDKSEKSLFNNVFFQDSELFFGTNFPNAVDDIPVVCDKMVRHATGSDDIRPSVDLKLPSLSHQDWWPVMKKDLLWTDAKDVW